jgi:hypothetical protein
MDVHWNNSDRCASGKGIPTPLGWFLYRRRVVESIDDGFMPEHIGPVNQMSCFD